MKEHRVSQNTVVNALNKLIQEKHVVSEHRRGMFISERASQKNIGVVFGRNIFSTENQPVSQMFFRYAEEHAVKNKENVSFFINTRQVMIEDHEIMVNRDLADALKSGNLDGVLLMGTRGPSETNWLASQGLPLVVFSNCPGPAYGVGFDIAELVRLGTEALAEQGCRRIALLTMHGHQRDQGFFDDLNAYREVLAGHKLESRGEWIWDEAPKPSEDSVDMWSNEPFGFKAAMDMLSDAKAGDMPFDALISTDDMASRGFVSGMRRLGLTPGHDLRIATHANRHSSVLLEFEDELIRVEVDPEELVDVTVGVLRKLIDGELKPPGLRLVKPRTINALCC